MTAREEHTESTSGSLLKIALVGYGRWGTNVARDLSLTEGAALTHVVDVSPQALGRAAKAHPAAAMAVRLADVLDAVDAIAICTPPATHVDLAVAAVASSKHVFVEKPIAMVAAEAERLEAMSAARRRVLAVGHQMLYHGAFEELRRVVASGEFGPLRAVRSERSGVVDATRDPGVLWAYGPHDVSMILELVGRPPRAIRAQSCAPDEVSLSLDFGDGLASTTLLRGRAQARVRRLTAICERGEVDFDDFLPPEAPLPLARELADFVACAFGGGRPRSDGRLGVLVTRVLADAGRMLAEERPATSSFRWTRALS